MSESASFDELFVEFGQKLRGSGLSIGSDDVISFLQGIAELNPTDIVDIYWVGRTTLVHRKDQIPTYDIKFREFFLDIRSDEQDARKVRIKSSLSADSVLEIPSVEPGTSSAGEEETKMGLMAATSQIWRSKAFAECTPKELATLRKMISTLKLTPPVRRTRRLRTTPKGNRLNMRRIVRAMMRSQGDPKDLFFIKRKIKLRPIIFILDVSGSMADYSRNLLQFAYSARRANAKVEVFCFGTRLTRITNSLNRRTPDEAMLLAGTTVLDWDGGTQIGDSISRYVKDWGRSRFGRGSIVVICSDGLDRGSPEALSKAMENLSRLSYRIFWMNPHKADMQDYQPNTLGMMVSAPYIDEIVSGHNFRSLEEFSRKLMAVR
ncbi:MAG: VWA domain-containing protein [Candidatus Nanopelagicaceae bacterium]|nr:VWA domain-containing protein [Candidatus Nanopelagicaceae bacterium]